MNFVAIDFETATCQRNSACSVAVVEVRDGRMYDSYYTLIRPPEMRFDYRNVLIHGITAKDVRNMPTFRQIWPELRQRLEGRRVLAHNASFDMSVLKACLDSYGLARPHLDYYCTVQLAKKVWPELENHKLNTLADHFHILFQHHNAMDDARTCAYLAVLAGRATKTVHFEDLVNAVGWNQKVW